jgi:hypothetical protein
VQLQTEEKKTEMRRKVRWGGEGKLEVIGRTEVKDNKCALKNGFSHNCLQLRLLSRRG